MATQLFKTVLRESGLSVAEVANRAGVSKGTVYNAKKQKKLSIESMRALAYALRLGVNDIIWGRLPGATTKPIGPNQENTPKKQPTERLCDVHRTFYPVSQECDRCN